MNQYFILIIVLFSVVLSLPHNQYCGIKPGSSIPYPNPPRGMSLKSVQAIIRHGDRLPYAPCWDLRPEWRCDTQRHERRAQPNQPVNRLHRIHYLQDENIYKGNCMTGQLTDYGWEQHLTNGRNLRSVYVDQFRFINSTKDVKIRSTDYARTIQSSQALLEGMFPLSGNDFLDIYTVDSNREWMTPNSARCPKIRDYESEFYKTERFKKRHDEFIEPLRNDIAKAFGFSPDSVPENVFDCIQCMSCSNMTIPGNLTDQLFERIVEHEEWMYKNIASYPDPVFKGRLNIGELVANVHDTFEDTLAGQSTPKFTLYSAHDTTIMPYLNALGMWDGKWAPYASVLIHELFQSSLTRKYYVRMIYNGEPLLIPGCVDYFCEFELFSRNAEPVIRRNVTNECLRH